LAKWPLITLILILKTFKDKTILLVNKMTKNLNSLNFNGIPIKEKIKTIAVVK
jgi:hypothetical protein